MSDATSKIKSTPENTVLIIDRDLVSRQRIAQVLEKAGHPTLTAGDSGCALELARLEGVVAVVLDPQTDPCRDELDLEILDELRDLPRRTGLPVLIVTALGEARHRIQGLRQGAEDYLVKPFDEEELRLRLDLRLAAIKTRRQPGVGPLLRHALSLGDLPSKVTLGRYEAHEVIGKGAMGVVLGGVDPHLLRPVAIKILDPSLDQAPWSSGADWLHEGAALARFDHPNIVKVYEAGLADGLPYLVMELVDGSSLSERLHDGHLDAKQAVATATAVARALGVAHEGGWIHRDIKPGNILLGKDGSIKVTDFGFAGLSSDSFAGDRVLGTPGYVPPECLLGEPHTFAGDLFALGSVLFYALTGQAAFGGESLPERLAANVVGRPDLIAEAALNIPRPLRKLITQLLDPSPAGRPESARVVERRLQWIAEALRVPAPDLEDLEPAETLPIAI